MPGRQSLLSRSGLPLQQTPTDGLLFLVPCGSERLRLGHVLRLSEGVADAGAGTHDVRVGLWRGPRQQEIVLHRLSTDLVREDVPASRVNAEPVPARLRWAERCKPVYRALLEDSTWRRPVGACTLTSTISSQMSSAGPGGGPVREVAVARISPV